MYTKTIVCESCHKPNAKWAYDNPNNSSRFCVICGSYCSDMNLTEEEIERYQERHEYWLSIDPDKRWCTST